MTIISPPRPGTTGRPVGANDWTQPIRIVVPAPAAATRSPAIRAAVLATLVVLALAATASIAYVLGGRNVVPAADTGVAPAGPSAAPVAAPASPVPTGPGPALVDVNGAPVDSEVAVVVTRVYRALDVGDLEPVRQAYSASGSDDWHASSSHLEKQSVRTKILAALRTAPSAHDGYRYSAGSYAVQFGQGDRYARPGLLTIDGPWNEEPTASTPVSGSSSHGGAESSSPPASSDPVPTSCASGTIATPTEGHPCQDPDTGRGVDYDGTVGVHGLKPCPYGTEIPSDPNEPTRNASTGEVCGY